MTADSTILIAIKSDGSGAKVIKRDLDEISQKSDKSKKSVDLLKSAFVGLAGVLSVRAFVRFSDTITALDTKLKNVSKTSEIANRRFDELFKIAQNNGDSIDGLVQSYSSLSVVLEDSIRESTDLVKVTDLLSRGFAASSASAQTAAGATLQLTQGLATNFKAAGQELNSIIEGAPILAKAIAENLGGKSAADLKIFAEEGRITSESFLKALLDAETAIKAFEIPPTIGRSIQRISNRFIELGRESNVLKGISGGLAIALDSLANSLDTILKTVQVLVLSSLPLLVGFLGAKLPKAIALTRTAFLTLTAAMAVNPFIALATGVAAVISAFFTFRKEIALVLDSVNIFGVNAGQVFADIGQGAEIIFKTIANTISGVFSAIVNVIKGSLAQVEVLFFRVTDRLARTSIGKRIGVTSYDLGADALEKIDLANQSIAQRAQTGFNQGNIFETVSSINNIETAASDSGLIDTNSPRTPPLVESLENVTKGSGTASEKLKDDFKDIGNVISDAFEDGFGKGEGFLGDFIGSLKNSFLGLFNGVSGSIGQILRGAGSSVAGGVLGTITGGKFGNPEGISGSLSGIDSGISKLITSNFDKIGNVFGISNLSKASTLTNGSFGGSLGGAAGGFAGNFAANAIFGDDRGIGASIGGTLGAIAGSFIPIPIVGTALGAFAGNAIGGLFGGNSTPSGAVTSFSNLQGGRFSQGRFSEDESTKKSQDFFKKLTSTTADSLNAVLDLAGADITGKSRFRFSTSAKRGNSNIRAGVEGITGKFFGAPESQGVNFRKDAQAASNFVIQKILETATIENVSSELEAIIRKSAVLNKGDASAIGFDISLAKLAFGDNNEQNVLKNNLQAINDQFKAMKERAVELGLPLENVNKEFEKQKEALFAPIFSPLQSFLDQQALSGDSSLNQGQRLSLARSAFDENIGAIKEGDFADIGLITQQASQLLSIGRDVFASGEGFTALESFVRQSITGIAGDLGAEGQLNDSVVREISLGNAQQVSIQEQILVELQETRAENLRLRKAMERIGNQVVISS